MEEYRAVRLVGYDAVLTGGKRIHWTEEADGVLACPAPMEKPQREKAGLGNFARVG